MELSAVVKEYNLPLTRGESNLVDHLSGGASEQVEQRMKALAEARDVLKQLPDRRTAERRSRLEKAAMLKERLKMLKQMLPFLSPSAAKSLKSEMKQIAGQIAALGAGGGNAAVPADMSVAERDGSAPDGAETVVAAKPSTEDDQGDSKNQDNSAASDAAVSGQGVKNDAEEERKLREAVEELKSLFKTVLEALKRKQKSGQVLRGDSPLRAYVDLPDSSGSMAVNV